MKRRRLPWVFRMAGALLLASVSPDNGGSASPPVSSASPC